MRHPRLIKIDGPHISPWAATIATLTRVGEAEANDDCRRTRRLDRRIRKVTAWLKGKKLSDAEMLEMAAAAIVAFIEENRDRKQEAQSSTADHIRSYEMDRAGQWLTGTLRQSNAGRRMGGINRHANTPVALAKIEAFKLWQRRHQGQEPRLRTVEQFATEVMKRWPVLTSPKVICGWSTHWTKAEKERKKPVC